MAEYCKVCGVGLSSKNTVDYRPGSCRDCELERKKLYSGVSFDTGSKGSKAKKHAKSLRIKIKGSKKDKKVAKKLKQLQVKLKKQKLLKVKKLKAKKIAIQKRLAKIRAQREKKRKSLRLKIERLRKLRAKKALKLKSQRKKQKQRERKAKEKLKLRLRKAKERERNLLQKERERLRKEKERMRLLVRQEKERIRAEKRADKDRIRAEKQRVKLEKQQEKERLKKAKEAAKLALVQARDVARQAAHEARRLREEAKKPPIVSVVTTVKELELPPNVKVVGTTPKDKITRAPQPIKVLDPKKPMTISGVSSSLLESATTIPAKGQPKDEKEMIKQSSTTQHHETVQKEAEKLRKDTDPIIDRYNPYSPQESDPNAPRPPSPTPWLTSNFSVVKGDFQESKQDDDTATSSGLSDQQVKDIIEKIKSEHKRKST